MITTLFLNVFYTFLSFILSPILSQADVSVSSSVLNAVTNIQGFLTSAAPVFPITTLLSVLGIVITVEIGILVYKAIMWLVKKIPMIS